MMPAGRNDRESIAFGWLILIGILGLGLFAGRPPDAAENQPGLETPDVGALSTSPSPAPAPTRTVNPFTAGSWVVSGYGSAAVGKTSHQVYAGHMGLGYYFIDHLALNVEGVGYFVDHAHNTGGGGLDLLPRWHFLVREHWSMYLDGGWGLIYTSDTLRDPGTHFNFTLQAGIGATYKITDRFSAMVGYRWFHISNARIRGKNQNVGFDSPMFYLGLTMPL